MIEIIGLSGKAGSGKDFVGREILRPAGFDQWAFAWPMKVTAIGQGLTYEEVFVTKPPAVRDALQQIGTEKGWMVWGHDYWLKQASAWLTIMHDEIGLSKFYFSDVRFPHELDWVHSMGGKVVRLELGDRPPRLAGAAAQHSSETALDYSNDFDLVIVNGLATTVEDLGILLRGNGILA